LDPVGNSAKDNFIRKNAMKATWCMFLYKPLNTWLEKPSWVDWFTINWST